MAGAALAVAPLMPSARVLPWLCSRPWQGACRGSCGCPRLGSHRGSPSSGPHLISYVYDLDEDLHATTEAPPEPWFQCSWWCWDPWAQGWLALLASGRLPRQGSCRGCLGKALAEGAYLALLCFWSWRCLVCLVLRLLSGFPPLPCYVWPWHVALTARAQVKGSKGEPLLLYTDKSPRVCATHKRDALLGQAQNGARAGGADFTVVTVPSAALPHDPC